MGQSSAFVDRLRFAPATVVRSFLPDQGFTPPYEISYRGVILPRIAAGLGLSYLQRGTDLPQVGLGQGLL
jgi:hypothetical protein